MAPPPGVRKPSQGTVANDEVFAVDRNRSNVVPPAKAPNTLAKMPPAPREMPPASGRVVSQNSSDPQEFPIPFAVSGVKPKIPPPKSAGSRTGERPTAAAAPKASARPATLTR